MTSELAIGLFVCILVVVVIIGLRIERSLKKSEQDIDRLEKSAEAISKELKKSLNLFPAQGARWPNILSLN